MERCRCVRSPLRRSAKDRFDDPAFTPTRTSWPTASTGFSPAPVRELHGRPLRKPTCRVPWSRRFVNISALHSSADRKRPLWSACCWADSYVPVVAGGLAAERQLPDHPVTAAAAPIPRPWRPGGDTARAAVPQIPGLTQLTSASALGFTQLGPVRAQPRHRQRCTDVLAAINAQARICRWAFPSTDDPQGESCRHPNFNLGLTSDRCR